MIFDVFTTPIAGGNQDLLLEATAKTLTQLGFTKETEMRLIRVSFGGTLGDLVGRFKDDGTTPTANNGTEIFGADTAIITLAQFSLIKIIAIGTPVTMKTRQYEEENLFNKP